MTSPREPAAGSAFRSFSAQSRVANQFIIEREIGRGGMATVFLARDVKHERLIAIKILRQDLTAGIAEERFLREIRTAARLSHPHILALHDSGSDSGYLYYTMPYVDGESLRHRLRRERQLDIAEAVRITRQVALALDYAHREGVVHRDIKPENILLHAGEALVADFGVAGALGAAIDERITETGIAVGTVLYMSPEQTLGTRDVDGRSDIYSLGCVLYEMLAGDPPFVASTPQAIAARKVTDAVPALRSVRVTVSPALEGVIMHALAKAPADRFASAREFAEALDAVGDANNAQQRRRRLVLTSVVIAAGAIGWWSLSRPSRYAGHGVSLAVLPCKVTIDDPSKRYLADGMTGDLITQASKTRAFDKVIALPSVARYDQSTKQPREIASELGVSALLYCDYRRVGSTESIRAQGVDARTGADLWSKKYETDSAGGGADQLPVLVINGLTSAIGSRRAVPESAVRHGGTSQNVRALSLFKEGRFFVNQVREEALLHGMSLLREAIVQDSAFAFPYVELARGYYYMGIAHGTMDEREAFPLLKEAAEHALALDESADAYALLGAYELYYGRNWMAAGKRFRSAIELDPNSAQAFDHYSVYLAYLGRTDEALAANARARELSPVDPILWSNASVEQYLARRYAQALPFIEKALVLDPNLHATHWILGSVYAEMGDYPRSLKHLRRADSLSGRTAVFHGFFGYGLGLAGDSKSARVILRELMSDYARRPSGKTATAIALTHIGLGERDSAFKWIETSLDRRSSITSFLLISPPAQRLATDPRYGALLRRVGLSRPH